MIYPRDLKWYERPLACILGLHIFRQHPGIPAWVVCDRCDGEKQK